MRIEYLLIRNFKSIRELEINDIEDVLILVGRNNAGKSVVLDAIRAVTGDYEVSLRDFNDNEGNISITVRISIEDEDLAVLYQKGQVSSFKHYDLWYKDFCNKLPSLKDGILEFEYVYSRDGKIKYRDGVKKNNIYIKTVLPRIFYVDHERRKSSIQEDLIMLQGSMLKKIGSQARRDIEDMLECQVNLQLWVKVKKDWRDSDFLLKNFGYNPADTRPDR